MESFSGTQTHLQRLLGGLVGAANERLTHTLLLGLRLLLHLLRLAHLPTPQHTSVEQLVGRLAVTSNTITRVRI